MTTDANITAENHAWDLIESGIAHAEAGEHDNAIADLLEAERLGEKAGFAEVRRVSLINQGFAHSTHGDAESAVRLYGQAADCSREAADAPRLALSLANMSVELKQLGRHEEAIAALKEYLGLLGKEDVAARVNGFVNMGLSQTELGEHTQADLDLDEAAQLASQAADHELLYIVRASQAHAYLKNSDPYAAMIVLDQALDSAQVIGDPVRIQDSLMSLAQVCRRLGQIQRASELLERLVEKCRESGDTMALADALYWHATVLRQMKQARRAIALWQEEEVIRREHGQNGHLADCLFAQADALRALGDHEAADPLFTEATHLFTDLGITAVLPGVQYWHAASAWAAGDSPAASTLADAALDAAEKYEDDGIARRAQGLRAMALADTGDIEGATAALDAAEALCEQADAHSTMVWVLARRAYVYARAEHSAEDVVAQLRRAHEYAMINDQAAASRSAVRKIARYIVSRCDGEFAEALDAYRQEQLDELAMLEGGNLPPGAMEPMEPMEPAPSDLAVETPEDDAPDEE